MSQKRIKEFQKTVWDFYLSADEAGKKNKRNFPWRNTKDPYKILVSEIMLQQTQADRVVVFYERWINRFPDFTSLAKAKFSEIYPYWQGLGYNRRAQNLQKTAQKVVKEYGGKLPTDVSLLEQFYGIGPYTARAVSIFSFNTPVICIETNIRRVFIHEFFPRKKFVTDAEILKIAEKCLPLKNQSTEISNKFGARSSTQSIECSGSRKWHWALMDYGSYLKSLPAGRQANRRHKNYSIQSKFEGSLRQIRGAALRILSGEPVNIKTLIARIKKATDQDITRIKKVLATLKKEELIMFNKKIYSLK